jgi:tRNA dimethylallyltransferase
MITIPAHKPVLIAGPTASGKSALALHIARTQGGVIVNADALQVFSGWRIITARPDETDLSLADHALYGHVPFDADYSVGHWLRDVTPFVTGDQRPIIIGGTGLNFTALTQGLAQIPATPNDLRLRGNDLSLNDLLSELDAKTTARIDTKNRMRVQRAWEVLNATGRPLADWQDETPPPVLAPEQAVCLNLNADPAWLNDRITRRFDQMLDLGVLDEARAMRPTWNPAHASSKAIGAPELIAHIDGAMTLKATRDAVIIGSRQYAKRQRTWFRSRNRNWFQLAVDGPDISATLDLPQ